MSTPTNSIIPSSARPTQAEIKIMDSLVAAWEEYMFAFSDSLGRLPNDLFRSAIVQAQDVILNGIGQRIITAEVEGTIKLVQEQPATTESTQSP